MKLLVTGGAGFIGSNFVRRALQLYDELIEKIIVLDKLTYAGVLANLEDLPNAEKFEFVKGDICNPELVSSVIKNVDHVVNFAAESHVDRSIESSEDFILTNINGVRNILDQILMAKKKIRFLQVSTDEVYGSILNGSWDESFPLEPNSPYSASKASADLLVRAYVKTHNVDAIITRCSNNYGPYQFPEKLIPLFITNLIEGKKLPIYGNGLNIRDWLHVDDHCDGIFLALTRGKTGQIYNIGGGKELTNIEITQIILKLMDGNESSIEYVEDRKGHDLRYSINYEKLATELGYSPKNSFEKGLSSTIDWYIKNENWWKKIKQK